MITFCFLCGTFNGKVCQILNIFAFYLNTQFMTLRNVMLFIYFPFFLSLFAHFILRFVKQGSRKWCGKWIYELFSSYLRVRKPKKFCINLWELNQAMKLPRTITNEISSFVIEYGTMLGFLCNSKHPKCMQSSYFIYFFIVLVIRMLFPFFFLVFCLTTDGAFFFKSKNIVGEILWYIFRFSLYIYIFFLGHNQS